MRPFRTIPRLVRPPWGGSRLAAMGKGEGAIGESWEVWGENRLEGEGRTLREVVDFPLLVKLLDTSGLLSVQVHPGDAQAREDGAPHGKAEGWVVLHAEPGARIALGLRREMRSDELRQRAASGEIEADLAWMEPRPGDVIDVPPGTIHAIGAGILLYEVQQPVDLTYRLYDWGRARELHLDRAVRAADLRPRERFTVDRTDGAALLSTPNFTVERHELPTKLSGWCAATVVDGPAMGATWMVPPGEWRIDGEGTALVARVGGLRSPPPRR